MAEDGRGEQITPLYKLFNTVCQENPDHILRYLQPSAFRKSPVSPLWSSPKNVLGDEKVPCCSLCKEKRYFEL